MPIWSRNFARTPLILLGLVEVAILFASVYFARAVAIGDVPIFDESFSSTAPKATTLAAVMLVSLIAMGLYQFHQRAYFREVFVRIVVGIAAGSLVLAVVYYAVPSLGFEPRIAAMTAVTALLSLSLVRYTFLRFVDENIFRRRIVVYGAGQRSKAITELRRRADRRGFRLIGTVAAPGDQLREDTTGVYQNLDCLKKFAIDNKADEIVIAMDDRRGNLPVKELLACRMRGIEVLDILAFLERETGKIRLDLVNPGWLIFSQGFRITAFRRFTKRTFDLIFGVTALVLAAPVMLVVALLIKLYDGWTLPVIYRQERVGYHGETFNVLKFRSMRPDAEKEGTAQWAVEGDPRVTKIGNVLRKYRLDELPQIFNVLVGQMSIVGPRPERPQFVERLQDEIPYYAERHTVKPGVTGWAQLKYAYGSSTEDAKEKLQYDLYYVKNHSLLLDLMIILQTVEVVLWGKGAR